MPVMIDHLNEKELGLLAGRVVVAVGMQAGVVAILPPPVERTSWRECYERGLARLARPVDFS